MYSELKIISPNFLIREYDPSEIILLYSVENILTLGKLYGEKESGLSVHYVVTQDGKVVQFVECESRAMSPHDNGYAIVITLSDVTDNNYGLKQVETLVELVAHVCGEWKIPLNKIQGDLPKFPFFEFLNGVGSTIIQNALE